MKNKFSPTRFYLFDIIFYTCLLAFPRSAAQRLDEKKNEEWDLLEGNETNSGNYKESSPKVTKDEQIAMLINKINKKNEQLKEQNQRIAELQNMLQPSPKKLLDKSAKEELFKVIKRNEVDEVEKSLKICQNVVSAKDSGEWTLLLCVAWSGNLEILKVLIKKGAKVNAQRQR